MSLVTPASDYQEVFQHEAMQMYPSVLDFENRMGYQVDLDRFLEAARVLACPVKFNPPNWQHGRVIYAAVRKHLSARLERPILLDIGTAKGFSALCLYWAAQDAGHPDPCVYSVDVINPHDRIVRNTIAESTGLKTLWEILQPWPESDRIQFCESTGIGFLERWSGGRIDAGFIDGKHTPVTVLREGELLAQYQQAGDLAIFDDVQLVEAGVRTLARMGLYTFEYLWAIPTRGYAIGVRT